MEKVYTTRNINHFGGVVNLIFDLKIKDLELHVDMDAEFEDKNLYFVDFNDVEINGASIYDNGKLRDAFYSVSEDGDICFRIELVKRDCEFEVDWVFSDDMDVDAWVAEIKKLLNKIQK